MANTVTDIEEINERLDDALEEIRLLRGLLDALAIAPRCIDFNGLIVMSEGDIDSGKAWILGDAGDEVLYWCWERLDGDGPRDVGSRVHLRVNVEPATGDRLHEIRRLQDRPG